MGVNVIYFCYDLEMVTNNTSNIKFWYEDFEVNIGEKIVIGVFWILIVVFGNGFLIGIIQFDRFGGDPLKRRIVDQVNCLLVMGQ